ncbi:MAG: hypothetical protein Q9207_003742 [Kuettlingeria erythrocarpa]
MVPDLVILGAQIREVGQGAALWKPGYDLARLISGYWHTTEWEFFEEDPAMIWEIPEGRLLTSPAMPLAIRECITQTNSGTEIPKVLQLLQHESTHLDGDYVLQPAQPMLFETLNQTIRDFQKSIVTDGYNPTDFWPNLKYSRLMRLHDWMTADNPLMNRYPEITEGYIPDKEGNSYGKRYTWETVRLVRKPVPEGCTSKGFDNQLFHSLD